MCKSTDGDLGVGIVTGGRVALHPIIGNQMPEITCPNCNTINKCPSCTDYFCVLCGEDIEEKSTMKAKEFMKLCNEGHERSRRILLQKSHEYSTHDGNRLQQFYDIAEIASKTPTEALIDQAMKHVTSISTMSKDPGAFDIEEWDEKLTDLRNYTYLMDALVRDMRYGKDGEDG